jgi:hypothetical protein
MFFPAADPNAPTSSMADDGDHQIFRHGESALTEQPPNFNTNVLTARAQLEP